MDISKREVSAVVEEVGKKSGVASFILDGQVRQARFQHKRTVELCGGDTADLRSRLKPGLEVTLLNLKHIECLPELQKGITFQADWKLINDIPKKKGNNLKSALFVSGLSVLTSKNKSTTSRPNTEPSTVPGIVSSVIKHKAGKVPRTVRVTMNNKQHNVFIHFSDTKVNGVGLTKFKTTELLKCNVGMQVVVRNLIPYFANGCTYEGAIDIDITNIPKNESKRLSSQNASNTPLHSTNPSTVGTVTSVITQGSGAWPQSSLVLRASTALPSQNASNTPLPSTNPSTVGTVTQ